MVPRIAGRLAALMLLTLLGTAACTGQDDGFRDVVLDPPDATTQPTAPTGPAAPTTAADADSPAASPHTPSATSSAGDASPLPTTEPPTADPGALTPADDAASVGANARAMLRGDRPRLVIEIDVQDGVGVDQDAVDHMVEVLGEVVDKPAGIVFEGGTTFTDPRTRWTTADLREAAAAHRSTATTDQHVSVHVMYVAGGHERDGQQTDAIGLATSASTVVLFPDRWQGLTSLLGSGEAIERAVLVHELGHLLALVNLGYVSDIDHEDPEHPGHSSNRGSVMYHAVESTLVGQVFDGPPPARFDDADLSDLEGLRTGRL